MTASKIIRILLPLITLIYLCIALTYAALTTSVKYLSMEYSYLHDRLQAYDYMDLDHQIDLIEDLADYNKRVRSHGDPSNQITLPPWDYHTTEEQ